jgi:hypothetical protein
MEHAQAFVEDLDKQEFIADLKTRAAAERAIEIIGEASRTYPTTYARGLPKRRGARWPECVTGWPTSILGSTTISYGKPLPRTSLH